ncbi:MAG: transposase, partial [Deltaproteobacteria bacterium]
AELVIERPPVLPELSDAQVRAKVLRRLKTRERAFAAERRRRGRTVLGARKASRVSYLSVPKREEMFVRNPTFSGLMDEARRAMAAAVTAFRRAYRAASRSFREGVRDVVFPAGTWLYRVRYQACCETAGPP